MEDIFERTRQLIGQQSLKKLQQSSVIVFGVGGVGGYVVEGLARSGVGKIAIVDKDVVALSNINRQIIALQSSIGKDKVEVMKERILDINPNCIVQVFKVFYLPSNAETFDLQEYDYVVDAIDTVTAKLQLVEQAGKCGVKIISSMATGNKLNPFAFKVDDIFNTKECPLCRVMRKELKSRGVEKLKVVYSEEAPCAKEIPLVDQNQGAKLPIASIAFVPSVVGMLIASEVIKDLIK